MSLAAFIPVLTMCPIMGSPPRIISGSHHFSDGVELGISGVSNLWLAGVLLRFGPTRICSFNTAGLATVLPILHRVSVSGISHCLPTSETHLIRWHGE